jgi:hypothetical protein
VRDKYGNDLENASESGSSTSETEDSDAILDTPDKDIKFLQVLPLIQKKHPAVMKPDVKFFPDDDAAAATATTTTTTTRHKPVTVNDYVRSQLLEHGATALLSDSEDERNDDAPPPTTTLPYAGEQAALKQEFLAAFERSVGAVDADATDDGNVDDGGLLRQRANAPSRAAPPTAASTLVTLIASLLCHIIVAFNSHSVMSFVCVNVFR